MEEEKAFAPVHFSSFLLSLAGSALVHLGAEPDPSTGEKKISLVHAREIIDLLALLQEKTRGNLTHEEEEVLSHLLFTIRMKFVEVQKTAG